MLYIIYPLTILVGAQDAVCWVQHKASADTTVKTNTLGVEVYLTIQPLYLKLYFQMKKTYKTKNGHG